MNGASRSSLTARSICDAVFSTVAPGGSSAGPAEASALPCSAAKAARRGGVGTGEAGGRSRVRIRAQAMEARAGGWSWAVGRTFGGHLTTRTLTDDGPFCDVEERDGVRDSCRGVGTANEKSVSSGRTVVPHVGRARHAARAMLEASQTREMHNRLLEHGEEAKRGRECAVGDPVTAPEADGKPPLARRRAVRAGPEFRDGTNFVR